MKLTFPNPDNDHIEHILRKFGYKLGHEHGDSNEKDFTREIAGGAYPRFHIYAKETIDNQIIINLHLDQKKASYQGFSAHSGEYDGEWVELEMQRIKNILGQKSA